jgi:hypothetical protein
MVAKNIITEIHTNSAGQVVRCVHIKKVIDKKNHPPFFILEKTL